MTTINLPTDSTLASGLISIKNKIATWLTAVNAALVSKGASAAAGIAEVPYQISTIPTVETEVVTIIPVFINTYQYVLTFNTTKSKIPKAFELINTNAEAYGMKKIIMLDGAAFGNGINIANHNLNNKFICTRSEPPISFTIYDCKYSMTENQVCFTSYDYNTCFISGNTYQLTCYYWDEEESK